MRARVLTPWRHDLQQAVPGLEDLAEGLGLDQGLEEQQQVSGKANPVAVGQVHHLVVDVLDLDAGQGAAVEHLAHVLEVGPQGRQVHPVVDEPGIEEDFHLDTGHVVHGQYTASGGLPVDPGNHDLLAAVEIGGELLDAARLDEHVQFAENGLLELTHHVDQADDAPRLRAPLEASSEVYIRSMSSRIFFSIPGRMILTATSVPSGRRPRCTWATEAAAMETGSNSANTSSTGRTASKGTGGHPVLEPLQLFDVGPWQQVGPQAEHPTQLNKTGAELFQRPPQPHRRRKARPGRTHGGTSCIAGRAVPPVEKNWRIRGAARSGKWRRSASGNRCAWAGGNWA
jgi:hypothetical protein